MSLPPKILHWPGEMRKPWERTKRGGRSLFDRLWWLEYELLVTREQELR